MSKRAHRNESALCCCVTVLVCATGQGAAADQLYEIDFSEPFHMPGLPATLDLGPAPRMGPTKNSFSEPIVVSDHGPLTDGALRFAATDIRNLSQIELGIENPFTGLGVDFPVYRLEFDLVIDNLEVAADSFAILVDTPQTNRFDFRGDGLIQYGPGADFIGTFEEGSLIHVAVEYMGDAGLWSIVVDDIPLYEGPTQGAYEGLSSIRLSLDDRFGIDSVVYVDNIAVQGIPGPPTFALLTFTGWMIGARRRRSETGRAHRPGPERRAPAPTHRAGVD